MLYLFCVTMAVYTPVHILKKNVFRTCLHAEALPSENMPVIDIMIVSNTLTYIPLIPEIPRNYFKEE